MIFSQKSTLKDDIFTIIEKDDSHPKNMVFLLTEKLKMVKRFTFIKNIAMILFIFMETLSAI